MNREKLLEYRGRVMEAILPGLLGDLPDKRGQLETLMRLLEVGAIRNEDVYEKALNLANEIEDGSDKQNALLRILGEIDAELSSEEEPEIGAEAAADEPSKETQAEAQA